MTHQPLLTAPCRAHHRRRVQVRVGEHFAFDPHLRRHQALLVIVRHMSVPAITGAHHPPLPRPLRRVFTLVVIVDLLVYRLEVVDHVHVAVVVLVVGPRVHVVVQVRREVHLYVTQVVRHGLGRGGRQVQPHLLQLPLPTERLQDGGGGSGRDGGRVDVARVGPGVRVLKSYTSN